MEAKNYNRREFLKILGKGVVVSIVLPSLWAEHLSANSFFGHKMKNCFDDDINQPVSYTHLRAHETRHDLVCRLLLEKKKTNKKKNK